VEQGAAGHIGRGSHAGMEIAGLARTDM
jgi:hypothetical protein